MDKEVIKAFNLYKKAKCQVVYQKSLLLSILPKEVADEFHYNGHWAISKYPEYEQIFKELLER